MYQKKEAILKRIEEKNYIAAIKKPKDLERALVHHEKLAAVYLLMGNISNIQLYTKQFKERNVPVFVHIEKIGGLALNNEGIEFIAKIVKPDGILSTKLNLLKLARHHQLLTIQRVFMIDTEVFENIIKPKDHQPDFIEMMPSSLHSVITKLTEMIDIPILAGGLIQNVKDVEDCIKAGAIGVSTSNRDVWSN